MLRRHPFFFFIFIITFLVSSLMLFLQSKQFASFLKVIVARAVPGDLGLIGNFSDFSVKIYPPGISINKPKITFAERNLANIPEGSQIEAEKIDLIFRPVQMFSRNIRVKEVIIHKGTAQFLVTKKFISEFKKNRTNKNKINQMQLVSWEDLLRIRADSILFEDTQISFQFPDSLNSKTELNAKEFRVSQWTSPNGVLGYEIIFNSENTSLNFPTEITGQINLPNKIDKIYARLTSNIQRTEVSHLQLTLGGVQAQFNGSLEGDVFDFQGAQIKSEYHLTGDLEKISDLLKKGNKKLKGLIELKGKLLGKLENFPRNLTADYILNTGNVDLSGWEFSKIQASGKMFTKNSIPYLEVKRLEFTEANVLKDRGQRQEKEAGFSVSEFSVPLQNNGDTIRILTNISLDNIHPHTLVGQEIESVFPLSFRVSGNSVVDFSLHNNEWNSKFKGNFKIRNLIVDNEELSRSNKKYFKIISAPELDVSGEFSINKNKFETDQFEIKTPRGIIQAKGNVHFEKGFNLSANAQLNLEDIAELAESKLKGEGKVDIKVNGPFDDVKLNLNVDLNNTEFINLHFGHIIGNIDVYIKNSHILFKSIKAQKEGTSYLINGLVDAGHLEKIDLRAEILKGRIQDVHSVVASLISPLWWYPHSVVGDVTGTIHVTGGLNLGDLIVKGLFFGLNWDYFGERFKTVKIQGAYNKGIYQLEELRAQKVFGTLIGSLIFNPSRSKSFDDSTIQWKLKGEGLSFQDVDLLARLDFPNRGKILLNSFGEGKLSSIESNTQFATTDIFIRGMPFQPAELTAHTKGGKIHLNGNLYGATLEGNYDYWTKGQSELILAMKEFDFSPLLLILNPLLAEDKGLQALVGAQIRLNFNAGKIEFSDGQIKIDKFVLKNKTALLKLERPVFSNVIGGQFSLGGFELKGSDESQDSNLSLTIEGISGALRGNVAGVLDLQLLQMLSPVIKHSEGEVNVSVELQGKIKSPQAFGKFQIVKGKILVKGLDSPIENITGTVLVKNGLLSIESLEGELGDGRVTAGGSVDLFLSRWPEVHLVGNLQGNKIKVYPFSVLKLRGKLLIDGSEFPYIVSGSVLIDSGVSTEKFGSSSGAGLSQSMSYLPPATRSNRAQDGVFKLDVAFNADKNLVIRNDLIDAEFKANGKVINSLEVPSIIGNAHLVQGRLLFKDREFQLQSIEVQFDNPNKIDPKFSVASFTDISGTRIQLTASGRSEKYKIELSSHPSLPESEIFSLLALGYTNEDVRKMSTEEQALIQQSEAASLMLHSTDFNRDLKNKTGLQVEIDESIVRENANSAFVGQTTEAESSNTKIVIKRQIGKKLDVSVGSTVGGASSSYQEVGAEYKIAPGVSVMGVWDTSVNSGPESKGGYGIDIKLQKRFK